MKIYLRFFGPLFVFIGGIFALIGFASFFESFGNLGKEFPEYIWCAFLGIPLISIGTKMCKFGYLKPLANYLINETEDALSQASRITKGAGFNNSICTSCGQTNTRSSNFCRKCGSKLT